MITKYDKSLRNNSNVYVEALQLWMEVEKILLNPNSIIPTLKNEEILPHQRLMTIEIRLEKIGNKIKNLNETVKEAVRYSIREYEVCYRADEATTAEERERSYNNQQNWDACFVQRYAIQLSTADIVKFNEITSHKNSPMRNTAIKELLYAINIIEEYNNLFKELEDNRVPKEYKELKKKLEFKDEEIKIRDLQNRSLMRLLEKSPSNKLPHENLTGFECKIAPNIVKEIFQIMVDKEILSGNSKDFQAIFSNKPTRVIDPIKWLGKSQKKPYRGHQTKLYLFIERMLNGKFSAKDKRKAAHLFVDEEGIFFNPKMNKPKKYDRDTHDIFEKIIKEAKEKTRAS